MRCDCCFFTSSNWVCLVGRVGRRRLSSIDLNRVKLVTGGNFVETPFFAPFPDFLSLNKPFFGGGVGAIGLGERRLETLARHMFVCDLAWDIFCQFNFGIYVFWYICMSVIGLWLYATHLLQGFLSEIGDEENSLVQERWRFRLDFLVKPAIVKSGQTCNTIKLNLI